MMFIKTDLNLQQPQVPLPWSTFSTSAGEVGVHWNNVVVVSCVLGVARAGQFELLRRVGELEGGIGVGGVWQQRAFSLQQLRDSLEKLPEAESQGSLPEAVQLLKGPRKTSGQALSRERFDKSSSRAAFV